MTTKLNKRVMDIINIITMRDRAVQDIATITATITATTTTMTTIIMVTITNTTTLVKAEISTWMQLSCTSLETC